MNKTLRYSLLSFLIMLCGTVSADVKFDFTGSDAYSLFGLSGFSSNDSSDGDFTEDRSLTSGSITLTVSPSGVKNPNRMWNGSLRLYGGTLTISSADTEIKAITFELNNSKWGADNSANTGTLETGSWTGNAKEVIISISANTQIKSITVSTDGTTPVDPDPQPTSKSAVFDFDADANTLFGIPGSSNSDDSAPGEFNEDKTATVNGVTVTVSASDPEAKTRNRIWEKAPRLRLYEGTLTITSTSGEKISSILFEGLSWNSSKKAMNFNATASAGTLTVSEESSDKTAKWTGSEVSVVFTIASNTQIGKITVNLGEGGEVVPDPELPVAANIAAFKALATGTEATLTLTNAEVLYAATSDIYVRDATGAIDFYNTGLPLKTGQILNGSVNGKFDLYKGITPELVKTSNTNSNKITAKAGTVTPKAVSVADAASGKDLCDLVKLTNVSLVAKEEGNYTNVYAVSGSAEVMIYDKFKVLSGNLLDGIEADKTYDIEGILVPFNDVFEILITKDFLGGEIIPSETVKLPYSEDFKSSIGSFTTNDGDLPEGLSFVWTQDSRYGMKASAYVSGTTYAVSSWLLSPTVDMTTATSPVMTFSHAARFFNNVQEDATLWAKAEGGDWQQLTIKDYPSGDNWDYITTTVDLASFAGKKVQFGFKYTSTAEKAGTWEISEFSIKDNNAPAVLLIEGEEEFTGKTLVTITPSNPDNEVYVTIDGTDPAVSSTAFKYLKPFEITETTTVKAFEEGAELYAEKTFTKKAVEATDKTIADLNGMTESMNLIRLNLNNAVVTYVDGKNVYVREGNYSIMFYNTELTMERGQVLNGSIIVDYSNYYGIHEVKDNDNTNMDNLSITNGEAPKPIEVNISDILDLKYICEYIVLKNVRVVSEGKNFFAEDNAGNRVQLYKGVSVEEYANDGTLYNIEGLFNNIYKGAAEVQPVNVEKSGIDGIINITELNDTNKVIYNIAGQRVNGSFRGIVIINGKKYSVK